MDFRIFHEGDKDKRIYRKIIHIATTSKDVYYRLFALCDDGTVWVSDTGGEWSLYKSIPQEKINA
jgi:hypothetical protein